MCVSSYKGRYILAGLQPVKKAAVIGCHPLGIQLSIQQAYAAAVRQHGHAEDEAQLRIVHDGQKLQVQGVSGESLFNK